MNTLIRIFALEWPRIRWDWVIGVGIAVGVSALLLAAVAGGGMPLG